MIHVLIKEIRLDADETAAWLDVTQRGALARRGVRAYAQRIADAQRSGIDVVDVDGTAVEHVTEEREESAPGWSDTDDLARHAPRCNRRRLCASCSTVPSPIGCSDAVSAS